MLWFAYPITPDGSARPCPDHMEDLHGCLPCLRVRHVLDESRILDDIRKCFEAWDLEVQSGGLESVRAWRAGAHSVSQHVAATVLATANHKLGQISYT